MKLALDDSPDTLLAFSIFVWSLPCHLVFHVLDLFSFFLITFEHWKVSLFS